MLKNIYKITILFITAINLNAIVISNEIDSVSEKIINSLLDKAQNENWHQLNFDKLIIEVASQFIGTDYQGGTLEGNYEVCRVNFNGLDCVTFVESVLNISRIIKQEKYNIEDLFESIIQTRYRDGIITDYTSRLHYTADWIYQNTKNHIVTDITPQFGAEKIIFKVNFMSKNSKYYKALTDNPEFINKIELQEKDINSRTYYYIPKSKIKQIESKLQNGDIICIVTNKSGLDYAHLGFVYKHLDGTSRLMHASSTQKKVIIDTTISEYLNSVKTHSGITILRPQEPKNYD